MTIKKKHTASRRSPWAWIPSLYFAEALPYVAVMSISCMMYKRLDVSHTDIALYTSWLYLPWVIKPLWSPFIDLVKTKRWWVLTMELLVGAGLAGVAFTIPAPHFFQASLAFFWLMAFSSATHDIAADGFYMLELSPHEQALYVGIRSTFYRIATIAGQGLLIMLAGNLEIFTRRIAFSWSITFYVLAGFFIGLTLYHFFYLPRPACDVKRETASAKQLLSDFFRTFVLFCKKPQAWVAIIFMLFYRLPEALLIKVSNFFLIDQPSEGGLGLSTQEVGLAQGTVGVLGLTLGGIIGGIAVSRGGLKKWLWPMVWSITIPDLVYVYLSYFTGHSFFLINVLLFIEQFGYGFGFTAYMLYMIYYSQGEHQTAHYAICTAFMALSMMLPGMIAGWLQDHVGYFHFFLIVMACCLVTVLVASLLKIDPEFGKKDKDEISPSANGKPYRLVADSGSTKTSWCMLSSDGTAEKYISTQGINPTTQDEELIHQILEEELIPQISKELDNTSSLEIFFYGAGCTATASPRMKTLLETIHPQTTAEVCSDMLGAARALCGTSEGIVCILGTGSNSCYYDGTKISKNTPPLGYILGDEGSGAVLGKTLVGNLLKGIYPQSLKEEFLARFSLTEAEIIEKVYRQPNANRFLASLTPFLHEKRNDENIQRLLIECFEAFLIRNVDTYNRQDLPINFVGSIAWHFDKELTKAALLTGHKIGKIIQSPIDNMVEFHQTWAPKTV